jgi:uncharacterized 2Fe-2S/4Fe-4S cluster protein (DUF4445 family)
MKLTVQIGQTNKCIEIQEGQTILAALQAQGIAAVSAPCGGRGRCGKCTVTVEGKGEVLACMTAAEDRMIIQIPDVQQENVIAEEGIRCGQHTDGQDVLVAACDIGTTTVVCHLIDGKSGQKLATTSAPSSQRGFGADVLSRIQAAAAGNLNLLHTQITGQIREMLETMKQKAGRTEEIERLAVSGNTVMCHLLIGKSPEAIGVTPFLPEEYFGRTWEGKKIGLPVREVYIAPAVAGYVGGDITSDLLAVLPEHEEEETLLLDIGTNGEMVLGKKGSYLCCATAVGSAFEGAELTMGMPAATGAISHVYLDARRIRTEVIGATKAVGICGSGLLDALSILLQMGLVDSAGMIVEPAAVSVAYRRYLGTYQGQACVWLAPQVCLTQEDIRNLQLAKAAFAAGMEILLAARGITCAQVKRVLLAGGFGSYLNTESAARIGLIPQELLPVTSAVGNAAGEGAVCAAVSAKAREKLLEIKKSMHYIELSAHPGFGDAYMRQMSF